MNKNPFVALLLSLLPGIGHAYLGRPLRFIVYAGSFWGSLAMAFFIMAVAGGPEEIALVLILIAAVSGTVNFFDMVITVISGNAPALSRSSQDTYGMNGGIPHDQSQAYGNTAANNSGTFQQSQGYGRGISYEQQQEKSKTMLLSMIPGLGHMNLGLMQRGITFLIAFIGLFAIIVFLSVIMSSGAILVFLLALPIIWIYCIYDAVSLAQAKHRGAVLEDRSLFEGIEAHIASGHKNKVLAISLAIFPGAGHLYLGLQKRGLQLMAGFLLAIYIMDNLRLSLFLFILPLFWCFAFFDALGQLSRYERQKLSDDPILPVFVPYQKWLGFGLLAAGLYFIVDRVILNNLFLHYPQMYSQYMYYKNMLPTVIIAFVMVALGLRLAFGSRSILSGGVIEGSKMTSREKGGSEQ